MTAEELKDFLDEKVHEYNTLDFIATDPVQIPHLFQLKEDQEIAGFLASTIAWGNRKMIINNAHKMMDLMGNSPLDFVLNHSTHDLDQFDGFVHRTFNAEDLKYFIRSLKNIYLHHNGLEGIFTDYQTEDSMQEAISKFKSIFFEIEPLERAKKHVSDPLNNSAAKRINMFLRWMVRDDANGVDLGLWKSIPTSKLSCPLDVHSGNVARKLRLLNRKQNDAKALKELDMQLRLMDAVDPVKYDFALFGLGVFEGF